MDGLTLLGQGREAEVYALPDGSVLKLMREASQEPFVEREAAALTAVATSDGLAPRVRGRMTVDDRPGLVMDRVDGTDLLTLIGSRPWLLRRAGRTLALVHARVHEQAAPAELPPAYDGPLVTLVVPKPDSATYAPDHRMGDADGSLSLDQAVSEYSPADQAHMRSYLTQLEYQRGVFLAWQDGPTLVYIQIYQFRLNRESVQWNTGEQSLAMKDAASTAVFDEIYYGRWFANTMPSGKGAAHAYYFKGPFAVMVDTFTSGPSDVDGVKRLAIQHYQLLPYLETFPNSV